MAKLTLEEKEKLEQVLQSYCDVPEDEGFDLAAYIADVVGQVTGIHTEYGWYNQEINKTHISFCFLSETDIDFSDDEAEGVQITVQVDIWSKEDCPKLKKKVKKILKKSGFQYQKGMDDFEEEKGLYHKALVCTFNIYLADMEDEDDDN